MNAAAICLWILIAIIVIVIIVWVACECSKSSSSPPKPDSVAVVKYGDGKKQVKTPPLPSEMPFAAAGSSSHHKNFPTEELAQASRFPGNPPPPAMHSSQCSSSSLDSSDSICAPAGNSKTGYNLNVESLMPASWRSGSANASTSSPSSCGSESDDSAQWAAYAPSKAAFDSYITTAGSARLGVNTRTAKARNTGLPNLLRDAVAGGSSGPVPIGADAVLFNDSDFRQTLVYNSTGKFPDLTWC